MADAAPDQGKGEREKNFKKRLDEARLNKADVQADLMEGYFFTAPRRAREVMSDNSTKLAKSLAAERQAELQTTLGIECAEDFAGMVIDAFMPANYDWCKRGKGMLSEEVWANINEQVTKDDAVIMAAIRASALEAVIDPSFNPDLALGTAAIWIEDAGVAAPPEVRPVPIRNLDICMGTGWGIGARFYTKHVYGRDLEAELRGVTLPDDIRRKATAKPNDTLQCVWGFIPDYSVPLEERWSYQIHVDKKEVFNDTLSGEGSCPLVVLRFGVDPTSPWGDGPTLQSLPYLRVVDALAGVVQDNAEFQVDPSFIYENDGVLSFEGGLQHGMAYPAQPGLSKSGLIWLRPESREDAGLFTIEKLEMSVKRLHYSDFPEQKGKTPPTASQWIDEMVKMQKRLGLKGQMFWWEGPRSIFQRFRHLLEKRGAIRPIQVAGKSVALEPYNPAVRGQEFQEVQIAERFLSIYYGYGGIQAQAGIDVPATMQAIQKKLGDKLVTFLPAKQAAELLAQLIPQTDLNMGNTGAG